MKRQRAYTTEHIDRALAYRFTPKERLKSVVRRAQFDLMLARANRDARRPFRGDKPVAPPPLFIAGCGRSGTTLLGDIMTTHPQSRYILEPYHLWRAVEPTTDMTNKHGPVEARCILRPEDFRAEHATRFVRVFGRALERGGGGVLIEKTPINAMRLGWLEQVAPGARLVVLVRDGLDVVRSIGKLSMVTRRAVAGRPPINLWWGFEDVKWRTLVRDGVRFGHLPHVVQPELTNPTWTDQQRGAYEWLLSIDEADAHLPAWGERAIVVRYPDFTADPRGTLERICGLAGLDPDAGWMERASAHIRPGSGRPADPITLPAPLAEAFNARQASLGFAGRALAGQTEGSAVTR